MKNRLKKLIQSYSACAMSKELAGIKSFESAVTCRYLNEKGVSKCCSHQRRIRHSALEDILKILTKLLEEIKGAKDFDELYKIVFGTKITYIGHLTIYDIAIHIGYWLSPRILPQNMVYIHAGAEVGAMALYKKKLIKSKPSRVMKVEEFECLSDLMLLDKTKHGIPEDATFAMLVEDFYVQNIRT